MVAHLANALDETRDLLQVAGEAQSTGLELLPCRQILLVILGLCMLSAALRSHHSSHATRLRSWLGLLPFTMRRQNTELTLLLSVVLQPMS